MCVRWKNFKIQPVHSEEGLPWAEVSNRVVPGAVLSLVCGLMLHLKVNVRSGESLLIRSVCVTGWVVLGICCRLGLKCSPILIKLWSWAEIHKVRLLQGQSKAETIKCTNSEWRETWGKQDPRGGSVICRRRWNKLSSGLERGNAVLEPGATNTLTVQKAPS